MPIRSILVAVSLLLAAPAMAADPPAPAQAAPAPIAPTMGSVVSVNATTLVVKGADGKDVSFKLGPNIGVSRTRVGTTADLKPGLFIGTTAVEGPDGKLRATEVHIFPEAMRGTGEGHYPWGAEEKTTMTNGNLQALEGTTDGKTIKVTYKGGETTVAVPPSATITVIEPAAMSDVKPGTNVTVFATANADGTKTAMGIGLAPAAAPAAAK